MKWNSVCAFTHSSVNNDVDNYGNLAVENSCFTLFLKYVNENLFPHNI